MPDLNDLEARIAELESRKLSVADLPITDLSRKLESLGTLDVRAVESLYVPGAWQPIAQFGAGYAAHSAAYAPAFRKDNLGVVWMRGLVKSTATNAAYTSMFVLPSGYRPSVALNEYIISSGFSLGGAETVGMLSISTGSGDVLTRRANVAGDWMSLAQFTYYAEA
jgi:hypothetical protein